jgi:hypothetical protein
MATSLASLVIACLLGVPALSIPQDEPKGGNPTTPPEAPKSCIGHFLSERRTEANWYPDHNFPQKLGCTQKDHEVVATKSIPIYWGIIANNWTTATAKAKVEAAKTWFNRYCVTLDDKFVDLTKSMKYNTFVKELNDANAAGRDDYAKVILKDYAAVWDYAGAPKGRFLMVLFVDAYDEVEFTTNRWSSVSANYAYYPLILITAKDKAKEHILTHELTHGLGKQLKPSVASSASTKVTAPAGSEPYYDGVANSKSAWDEAPCAEDMGNPGDLSAAKNDAPVDWASYWEYTKVAKTLK